MSYYHPEVMHEALQRHLFEQTEHKLVSDPVSEAAAAAPAALTYHGGPLIAHPKVIALYSGTFWASKNQNDAFLKDIVENGYLSLGVPQGFGSGTFVGSFSIPAPASNSIVDADCQAMIGRALLDPALARQGLLQPDESTIYMLILPDGVSVAFTAGGQASCSSFCAYHSNTEQYIYTVQPANTCGGCNQGDAFVGLCMTQSHELAESCSDPRGSGWFNDQTGMENADEVAWIPEQFGPWTVQGYAGQDASGVWMDLVGPYTPGGGGGGVHQSTIALDVRPNPVTVGKAAVLSIQAAGAGPTGSVQVLTDGKNAGELQLDAQGTATGTLVFPRPGTHRLQAHYLGDAQNSPSDSNAITLVVQAAPAWSQDPQITNFLAWQANAASWCKGAYAAAQSAVDAQQVQAEELVIEQVTAAYLPYITGKTSAPPRMALPPIPRT